MNKRPSIVVAIALAMALYFPARLHAQDRPKPDAVIQKVLSNHGVDSKILRSYDQLKESSTRPDGRFLFNFEGRPGVQVLLDRNYWVVAAWSATHETDGTGYMFNPEDEQSALNIGFGNQSESNAAIDWSKEPGFTAFTSGEGKVGNQKVTWRRWSDQKHLYSECHVSLPVRDPGEPANHKLKIFITANTKERRGALEDAMATLQLQYARQ